VYSSKDKGFKITIPRRIAPNIIHIYDIYHSKDRNLTANNGYGKKMIIFGSRDED